MLNTAPDAPTFKGSLLECMLNGICEAADDDADAFAKKVQYSIIWEEPTILKTVLENTGLVDKDEKRNVLDKALIDAIARDNVDAVQALFGNPNVSVDQFHVDARLHRQKDILKLEAEIDHLEMEKYVDNAGSWFELISRMKQSKSDSMHVDVLKEQVKKQLEGRLKKATDKKSKKRHEFHLSAVENLAHLATPAEEEEKMKGKRVEFLIVKYEKRLLLLEGIYHNLLENFQYHVGMLDPYVVRMRFNHVHGHLGT